MLRPTQSFTGLPRWGSGLQRSSFSKGSLTFLGHRSKSVHGGTHGAPPSKSESINLEMTPQNANHITNVISQEGHVEVSHASLSRLRHSSAPGESLSFPHSAPSLRSHQQTRSPFDSIPGASFPCAHVAVFSGASMSNPGPRMLPPRGMSIGSGTMVRSPLETVHSVGSSGLGTLETAGSTRSLLPAGPSSSAQGLAICRDASESSQADSSGASFSSSEGVPETQASAAHGKSLSRLAHGSS